MLNLFGYFPPPIPPCYSHLCSVFCILPQTLSIYVIIPSILWGGGVGGVGPQEVWGGFPRNSSWRFFWSLEAIFGFCEKLTSSVCIQKMCGGGKEGGRYDNEFFVFL